MDEPETAAISGEIVKRPAGLAVTPPAADMRYDGEERVTRVFVRVEWEGGKIREYQAKDTRDFDLKESMASAQSKGRYSAGGLFTPLSMAVPAVRLSFTAHPRWNLHIRTEATAPEDFPGITYG